MVTQKDIAKRLGVSVALVSRALSGKASEIGAAPATIDKIFRTAEALGYVPNVNARMLKGAPTRTLGVVVYDFEDPFFGQLVHELQRLARENDYSLVLSGFQRRQPSPEDVRGLLKHRIDGLVVLGSGIESEWLDPFLSKRTPIACIGTGPAVDGIHLVSHDARAGIRMLVEHLAHLGHRRLGFIHSPFHPHQRRLHFFLEAVASLGLETQDAWQVGSASYATEAGCEAARRLFDTSPDNLPTALLAANDLLALGTLRACAERGLAVPDRMAVTGYDDIPYAHLSTPALTTVRQPMRQMVGEAFAWITGGPPREASAPATAILPTLVVRESTGPAQPV